MVTDEDGNVNEETVKPIAVPKKYDHLKQATYIPNEDKNWPASVFKVEP